MRSTREKPQSFDDCLARADGAQRQALEKLRRMVHAIVPEAQECVSYGLAAFRFEGKALIALGATTKHCAFYPMSSSIVSAFATELARYDTSKGTIRFQPDGVPPKSLVRKLLKVKLAEIREQKAAK